MYEWAFLSCFCSSMSCFAVSWCSYAFSRYCIFQLSCYRILRIDFALNEYATLKKKLVCSVVFELPLSFPFFTGNSSQIGRLELAQNVRYVIADALAYRNFGAVNFIAENAAAHLDKYSFFSGLEQIVYPVSSHSPHLLWLFTVVSRFCVDFFLNGIHYTSDKTVLDGNDVTHRSYAHDFPC